MSGCLRPADFEQYEEGTLSAAGREEVRAHLDSCDGCRDRYERFRQRQSSPEDGRWPTSDKTESLTPAAATETSPPARMARHFLRIEGYQINGLLGQGGMGIVYRAMQTKLNRAVALKVLPAIVGTASPGAVSRFRREATAAARLHHTNIIPIYDFGESRDAYYYAMELITGEPLNVLIRRFSEQDVPTAPPARLAELLQANVPDAAPTSGESAEQGRDASPVDEPPSSSGTSSTGRGRLYYRQVARWVADAADARIADDLAGETEPLIKRVRGLANLRAGQFAQAVDYARAALALGDMETINHLIIAIARANLGDTIGARSAFDTAVTAWPADLENEGDFRATAPKGVLWFETADELHQLRREAEKLP